MPTRKEVLYKEPPSYFNEDMKKVAEEWEVENKDKKTSVEKTAAAEEPAIPDAQKE